MPLLQSKSLPVTRFGSGKKSGKTKATAASPASPPGIQGRTSRRLASDISFGIRKECAGRLKRVFRSLSPSRAGMTRRCLPGWRKRPPVRGSHVQNSPRRKIHPKCATFDSSSPAHSTSRLNFSSNAYKNLSLRWLTKPRRTSEIKFSGNSRALPVRRTAAMHWSIT